MAVVNFYMQATGNDLNSGATNADNADYSVTTLSSFDGVSVFTVGDGSNPSSFILVGDYVSLYQTGDTAARCVAKVTAVTSTTVTIDTTIKYGTVPTSGSSGTRMLKHGGAWASLAITATNAAFNTGTVPQSTQVNIKAGVYANAATTRALGMAGTVTAPMIWSGYKTAINDQDNNLLAVNGTDIPQFTFTTATASFATHVTVRNVQFLTTGIAANFLAFNTTDVTFINVRVTNTNAVAGAQLANITQSGFAAIGCQFVTTSVSTKGVNAAQVAAFIGCYFASGITALSCSAQTTIVGCVFDTQTGDAVSTSTTFSAANCSFFGVGGTSLGNGINITSTPASLCFISNCYFEGYTTAAKAAIMNSSGANTTWFKLVGNAYFNCTANWSGFGDYPLVGDVPTLASSGYTAGGSDNFYPTTVLRGVGYPSRIPGLGAFTNYQTPGAVDASAVASSGVFHPLGSFIVRSGR
jgi:hypothetical protein